MTGHLIEKAAVEDEFKQRLLNLGLLTEIKPPLPTETTALEERQPIPVQGNPVSDLIMKERR